MNRMNVQDLPKNRQNFYYCGIMLIVFTIPDVISTISNVARGQYSIDNYTAEFSAGVLSALLITTLVIMLCTMMIQLGLGVTALSEAKNPTGRRGHITVAKIGLVFTLIGVIGLLYALGNSGDLLDDIGSLLFRLGDVALLIGYIVYGNRVRRNA